MKKTVTVDVFVNPKSNEYSIEMIEGESGLGLTIEAEYTKDNVLESTHRIGNEIMSWVSLMMDSKEEE